jgi:hypothetical protein
MKQSPLASLMHPPSHRNHTCMQVFHPTAGWYLSKLVRRWHCDMQSHFSWTWLKTMWYSLGPQSTLCEWCTDGNKQVYDSHDHEKDPPVQDGNSPVIGTIWKLAWFVLHNCCICVGKSYIRHFLLDSTALKQSSLLPPFASTSSLSALLPHPLHLQASQSWHSHFSSASWITLTILLPTLVWPILITCPRYCFFLCPLPD